MNKALQLPFTYFFIIIIWGIAGLTSCQKMPGHTIAGGGTTTTGGTTGGGTGGATFGTATGTITFQIKNGAVNTWTQPAYFAGLGTTPTTGALSISTKPATLVTAGPNDVQLFMTNAFSLSFDGITPGTYKMLPAGSFVTFGGATYSAGATTEIVTVTDENISITSTSFGTVTGSIKGTFDGYMQNLSTYDSVRVSGSFNVKL